MKLAIINGSPRGKKSNSNRIAVWITGALSKNTEVVKVFTVETKRHEELIAKISTCDAYLFIFPLYTDSMPAISKAFIEKMEDNKAVFRGKPVSFIIHSGFPESSQSIAVEKYTKYLSSILDMKYAGGIRMGGSEALQVAPDKFFAKKRAEFEKIAINVEKNEPFNNESVKLLSQAQQLNKAITLIMKFTDIGNLYWNRALKKNGAFDRRYDKPYAK